MSIQTHEQTLTCCCPHCGSAVEIEVSADGSVVSCPAPGCGKPFRVEVPVAKACATPSSLVLPPGVQQPATTSPPPAPPPPTNAALRSVTAPPTPAEASQAAQAVAAAQQALQPSEPETPPSIIHLSMVRRYPFRILGYLLLTAAGLALLVWSEMHQWHWVSLIGGAVAAAAFLRLFCWWVRMRCNKLILTNKRRALVTGVFHRNSTEFEFAQITDFHVHQTLLMRWLDVGNLAIVGSNGQQIVVMAAPHPNSVIAHLQRHVEVEKKAAEQPDMVVVQQPALPQGTAAPSA